MRLRSAVEAAVEEEVVVQDHPWGTWEAAVQDRRWGIWEAVVQGRRWGIWEAGMQGRRWGMRLRVQTCPACPGRALRVCRCKDLRSLPLET